MIKISCHGVVVALYGVVLTHLCIYYASMTHGHMVFVTTFAAKSQSFCAAFP